MTKPRTPTTRLTARSPEDLLAVVPVVLGFVPQESAVMLTFGAERTFHARVDLPPVDEDVPDMVAALLDPVCRHRVRRVVFILYAADPTSARNVSRSLVRAFRDAGVEVIDVLRADGQRWFPLLRARPGVPKWGVPYDVTAHRFAAQSVLDGQVTHASRAELAASLRSDPERVAELTVAVSRLPRWGRQPVGEEAWARSLVRRHVADGTLLEDDDAARLLLGLCHLQVRDAAWALMTRDNARAHLGLWTDLVRRAPDPLLAPPAALLAFAAWLAGQGALAWCAVDRCVEVDPGYRLAGYVAQALTHALSPDVWETDAGDGPGDGWGDRWGEGALADDPA